MATTRRGRLADLPFRAKRREEANAEYPKVIQLDPENGVSHFFLGAGLCFAKTDDQEAIAELREAIRLKVTFEEQARGLLASTSVRARWYEEAVGLIEPLVRQEPNLRQSIKGA